MSRFLIVTWDGAGNQLSTLGIARRLVDRGHDVRVLGHASIEQRCGADGWRFRPFVHTHDHDSTAPYDVGGEIHAHARWFWFAAEPGRDLTDELEREPADAIVVDCMLLGALSAAQRSGVPSAALFHAAFAPFRAGPLVEMLEPFLPDLNAYRADIGMAPVAAMSEVHDAAALSLVVVPREFEPEMPRPANARFVGPVLDGPPLTRDVETIAVADGPEPVIVASFSTSFQGQGDVVQRVVDALGGLDASVVVTTGNGLDPHDVSPAANTRIATYVSHSDLFPHASVVVTHAGLGTVMAALNHGVPLVCLPMGRDQFFNAAMVERLGAGRVVPADADAPAIRAAVEATSADGAAKDAAKGMARVIASYGGADAAAAELEALV